MPWLVTESSDGSVRISYDLAWILEVMEVSSGSMVPFAFFTSGARAKNRAYPRSRNNPGFILGPKGAKDASAAAGGRQHVDGGHRVPELCELFAGGNKGLSIPLSDIAILSKRAVCLAARNAYQGKNFRLMGGLGPKDKRAPGWPVYEYPMLCIIGGPRAQFPCDQAEWRVVQCVFGAVLTRSIRTRKIGVEVVSREGFGSVFPTLADLPDGIRLDPGLLPPGPGSEAIAEALLFVDRFITAMQGKSKAPSKPKASKAKAVVLSVSQAVPSIAALGGMNAANLAAVDRLMSVLLEFVLGDSKAKATPEGCADLVMAYDGRESAYQPRAVDGDVAYVLPGVIHLVEGPPRQRLQEPKDDSGYGSESDYEDEDEPPPKKHGKGDGEEQMAVRGALAVKKASVLSGMAALRMATYYGMIYSKALFAKRKRSDASSLIQWAPYFELDHDALYGGLKQNDVPPPGVRVLVCDGAPNPINIPDLPVGAQKDLGVVVIDTTNNTSREKAAYMAYFQDFLVQPKSADDLGGLLFMVDSASKHPTGGDLVHGVMRVCGSRASVRYFFKEALKKHLGFASNQAYSLTVLTQDETAARRQMIACRLVMRNGDLFNLGIASKSGSKTGGSKTDGSKTGGSKPGGVHGALPEIPDIPLSALANVRKVKRIVFPDVPVQAPDWLPKKKGASSESGDPSKKPSGDSSKKPGDDLASKKKEFEKLGKFDDALDGAPDLEEDGYYYEAAHIFDLQRYLLRNRQNVAVLHGISRPQWVQMDRAAYTTAVHHAITTNTDTIIQPLNRDGNHWALLYITLGAPGLGGIRPAKLLYIDPLHPDDVPVADLALLRLPFPGIEAEHCVIQYQDDGMVGQSSCGAWAVALATHLAENGHALPPRADNPRAAALQLRHDHQAILAVASQHPLPQLPAANLRVNAPPAIGLPVLRRHGSMDDMAVPKRSTSLGSMMRKGTKSLDDF